MASSSVNRPTAASFSFWSMADLGYDDGRRGIDELATWWTSNDGGDRNEATTRLHLIDELLRSVLGWPKEQTRAEVRFEGEIADYELGSPATRMILEAKREGIYFELPAGQSPELLGSRR